MTGKRAVGGYEAELNRIRSLQDWRIPKATALQEALKSLVQALETMKLSDAWEGATTVAANTAIADIQEQINEIDKAVTEITSAIERANGARQIAIQAELPPGVVDSFWTNAAKGASVVIHPVLGPLAADTAIDAIGDFLGSQREAAARSVVEAVEEALTEPRDQLDASSMQLTHVNFVNVSEGPSDRSRGETPGPIVPRVSGPGGGSGPSVLPGGPGAGYPPITPLSPPPGHSGGPGDYEVINPGGGGSGPGGGGSHPGGGNGEDPSVDSPGGGLLPGGPGGGGTGPSYPTYPGGGSGPGGAGSLPGGMTPGGGGLGGAIGGGAGAAAIAASSKIVGFGSMGGLGGAGSAAGAGMRSGGGLLGNTPLGGTAGAGGAGAGGGSGAGSSGAAGAGARPGMGMMGGAGGGDDEKSKRNGLGGPIAPKIEDEDEAGPRSKGARAGSRDDHRKD